MPTSLPHSHLLPSTAGCGPDERIVRIPRRDAHSCPDGNSNFHSATSRQIINVEKIPKASHSGRKKEVGIELRNCHSAGVKPKNPIPTRSKFSVLHQFCKLIPVHLVPHLARKTGVEAKARTFSPWSHVVSLIFAQISHARRLNVVDRLPVAKEFPFCIHFIQSSVERYRRDEEESFGEVIADEAAGPAKILRGSTGRRGALGRLRRRSADRPPIVAEKNPKGSPPSHLPRN
jgi:Domain of unknown function (DUF4372)